MDKLNDKRKELWTTKNNMSEETDCKQFTGYHEETVLHERGDRIDLGDNITLILE